MAASTHADSSAQVNPPKVQPPAFLQNLMNANQNQICTAKGEDVKKVSIDFILSKRARIPIFQRRYVWNQEQWATLFGDIMTVAAGSKDMHSIGRCTCAFGASDDGRIVVIDGQQRLTTCTLLLAAIRDVAAGRARADPQYAGLVTRLDSVLVPDSDALAAWLARRKVLCVEKVSVEEGESLDFIALIPTYCDRAAYFSALLPAWVQASESGEWLRPIEAKRYFLDQVETQSPDMEHLVTLAEVVLHKLEWLFFPIHLGEGHNDGTEDLQLIFERLAQREAVWVKPAMQRKEGANMGAADFVRNLLLGSFRTEQEAIDVYEKDWLPIERKAAEAMAMRRDGDSAEVLEGMLTSFLKSQSGKLKSGNISSMPQLPSLAVGGDLYKNFRKWLTAALAERAASCEDQAVGENAEKERTDRLTHELIVELKEFAFDYFNKPPGAKEDGALGPLGMPQRRSSAQGKKPSSMGNWKCSACNFPNKASYTMCTACMAPRPPQDEAPPSLAE